MKTWLANLLGTSKPDPLPEEDSELGVIVWNSDWESWISPPQGERTFAIGLSSDASPDPQVLRFARELNSSPAALVEIIKSALEMEATRFSGLSGLISTLNVTHGVTPTASARDSAG